jgi:ribosomal protein S18 acetylase RimI-like enzyme
MDALKPDIKIAIELLEKLNPLDLMDLCDATEATMDETEGFNMGSKQWTGAVRDHLELYFKGLMLVPERKIVIGRIDSTISASLQLSLPHSSNQTSNFIVSIDNLFVCPWARNIGIARKMLLFAEEYAKSNGYKVIKLSVRSTRVNAISLYESCGYNRWGVMDQYELVGDKIVSGFFYSKNL